MYNQWNVYYACIMNYNDTVFYESEMLELKRRVLEKLEETTDMLKLEECMALLTGMEIPVWYSDGEFLDELHMADKEEFVKHEQVLKDFAEWDYVR